MLERCPTCKMSIRVCPKKMCAACGSPITRHHKFYFRQDGRVQHRLCKYPDSYITPEEMRRLYGKEQPQC